MSLLNHLRPKWQNSDPEVRAEAVRKLDRADVELLTAVAQQDADARVRRVAIKKLDQPRLLLEIAESDEDAGVRDYASQRARQLLVQIACDDRDVEESTRALGLLTDTSDLASVAEKAHFGEIRDAAFGALRTDASLALLVCQAKDAKLRARALEKIEAPAALKSVIVNAGGGPLALTALGKLDHLETLESITDNQTLPKTVRRQALQKLSKLVPDDHPIKVRERRERLKELCTEAEMLAETPEPDSEAKLQSIESTWTELVANTPPEPRLAERYRSATETVRERLRRRTLSKPAGVGTPKQEPEPEKHEDRAAEAGPVLERVEDGAREPEHEAVDRFLEDAERVAEEQRLPNLSKTWQRMEKKWSFLVRHADPERKARFARAASRVTERQEAARLEREAKEQATLTEIQSHLKRMAELSAETVVSIKDADRELRAVQELLKNMGPLSRSVNRKKIRRELTEAREKLFKKTQDTRTLEEWKRWANADIQEGLIRRLEALREVDDTPKLAKELRDIHEEWKKAGAAPAGKAQELWARYKAVRDELKKRCNAFFKKQKAERASNLAAKEALCAEAEALQDSEAWNETAEAIKALQTKWKAIGPVPQKHSEAIWKRFRKACDHFFERRKAHFGELKDEREQNLKKKEALCAEAEATKASTDWKTAAQTFKHLQAEWRTIGPVPRKKSDEIWKRFRAACDYFFDRYKRRDEVEAEERVARRETLVEKVAELSSQAPPSDGVSEPVVALWSEWKTLGPLPESKGELQRAFEKHLAAIVARSPDAFQGTELDPKVSLKKRAKLVSRLETLVSELSAGGAKAAGSGNELDDLAARLKDALASNTIAGAARREAKPRERERAAEIRRLRGNWFRSPPAPGDEGLALAERFERAYQSFLEQRPRPNA